MEWITLIALAIVAILNFVDFMLSRRAQLSIKDWLARFYVNLDGDWRGAYQLPSRELAIYLSDRLGKSRIIALGRIAAISITITFIFSIALPFVREPQSLSTSSNNMPTGEFIYTVIIILTIMFGGNIVGDLIAWPIIIHLLNRLKSARPWRAIGYALLMLFAGVFGAWAALTFRYLVSHASCRPTTCDMGFNAYVENLHDTIVNNLVRLHILPTSSSGFFGPDFLDFDSYLPFLIFAPIILYIFVTAIGVSLYFSKSWLQKPVMVLLERIDASPKSFLQLSVVAIAVLLGIAEAASKLFAHK